jgi:hypothetical protein
MDSVSEVGGGREKAPEQERFVDTRVMLSITILLWIGSLAAFVIPSIQTGLGALSSRRQIALLGLVVVSSVGVGFLLSLLSPAGSRLVVQISGAARRRLPGRGIALALWLLSLAILPAAVMGPAGRFVESLLPRLGLFWVLTILGAGLSLAVRPGDRLAVRLPVAGVMLGLAYQLATYLAGVSAYPFTLGWSEASRYYYASLFLSRRLYGFFIPPSVLHPSRYLLQALPFLIPGSPIWVHRLWQVILWIASSTGTAYLLSRRLAIPQRGMRWLIVGWGALYLLQGPVYYHLLVCVILVLWGFDSRRLWRSLFVVVVASAWAGISRVNWIPVPGLLAATLYALETRKGSTSWLRYALAPAFWVTAGTFVGLGTQAAYVAYSGNPASDFGSSFFSQLLWYRLLPSETYPLGILLAAIIGSLPLALVVYRYLKRKGRAVDSIRAAGLAAILAVLFLGGLVVSVKIGGGSNLHNLDAFFSVLLIIAAYTYFDRISPEGGVASSAGSSAWLNAAIALVPMVFLLGVGAPIETHNIYQTAEALAAIQAQVSEAAQSGKDVLFISERQLLTFGDISGVRMFPDYETVFLMEMAMSENKPYLDAFHADLRDHRFALIVVHNLETALQGREHGFGEENDAWVREVSRPILCWYAPTATVPAISLQLLTPRAVSGACP